MRQVNFLHRFQRLVVPVALGVVLVVMMVAILPASRVGLGVSSLLMADAQGVPPHAGVLRGSQPGFDWGCANTIIGWDTTCEDQLCGGNCSDPCGGGEGGSCWVCEPTYNCNICTSYPIYPTYEQCVVGGWYCDSGYRLSDMFYQNLGNDGNAQWWQCNSN